MRLLYVLLLLSCTAQWAPAADSTSFNPVPVAIKSSGAIPVGTVVVWAVTANPTDMSKWLECNGQSVDAARYPELRALMVNVPDYRNQFLRGGTATQAGTQVADSTRSHAHEMDQHSHTVSGTAGAQYYSANVGPQSVNGWANGQSYQMANPAGSNGYAYFYSPGGSSGAPRYAGSASNSGYGGAIGGGMYSYLTPNPGDAGDTHVYVPLGGAGTSLSTTGGSAISGQTSGATVSGWTGGSNISGYTSLAGPSSTRAAGGGETAPMHTRIRYLIRALP